MSTALTAGGETPTPADILDHGKDLLEIYIDARRIAVGISEGVFDITSPHETVSTVVPSEELEYLLDYFPAVLQTCGSIHDEVAGRWISPKPPEFDRDAVSVMDCILRAAASLYACLEPAIPDQLRCFDNATEDRMSLKECCRLAARVSPELNEELTLAALRREARSMELCPDVIDDARNRVERARSPDVSKREFVFPTKRRPGRPKLPPESPEFIQKLIEIRSFRNGKLTNWKETAAEMNKMFGKDYSDEKYRKLYYEARERQE